MSDYKRSNLQSISQIRYINARALMQDAGSQVAMRQIINKSQSQVSQILGRNPSKAIGNNMARWIEKCFNKEYGWLDHAHGSYADPSFQGGLIHHLSWVRLRWLPNSFLLLFVPLPGGPRWHSSFLLC